MTFGVPLFLIAALAAAIPVVLHMVHHRRAKELPFSTLRFLQISVEKTRRRRRVEDLLLMLLRMAVFALIAVGLARPALTNLGALWGRGDQTAVAVILDNSASMGAVDEGQVRFETARAAAGQIMDELRDGDQVALLVPCGPQARQEGQLTASHDRVLQRLAEVDVSYERADLAAQLERARQLLARSDAPNKQIYVISDMQQLCWEGLAELKPPARQGETADKEQEIQKIPIIFADCHRAPKPNVAVREVQIEAAVPVAGLPTQATVELFNSSLVDQERHVELYIDGARRATSPAVAIPAGQSRRCQLSFAFQRGGLHRGEVRLVGDDGSARDDRRFFTMEVDEDIAVAVVKAERHEIPYLEDTYYVERALLPKRGQPWAIALTSLVAEDLAGEPLSNYAVVFCVNLPPLAKEAADRLAAYVRAGGHLVWISGDNVDPEGYNQMNEAAGGQLLPARLVALRSPQPGEGRDSWHIAFLDEQHPALNGLTEPPSLYQSVLVYRHVLLEGDDQSGVDVLARLDDGQPLLIQRRVSQGSVLFLGTSAHVGWTNLPLRPIFLPLLVQLTFHLAGGDQTRHSALAGSPLVLPLDAAARPELVEIQPPGGATIRLPVDRPDQAGTAAFRFYDTYQIGIYLLRPIGGPRPRQVAYAVNLDPDEPDETKITRQELEKQLAPAPLVFAQDPHDLSPTFRWLREGKSLWGLFLWAVLVGLVFETFVSNWLTPKGQDDTTRRIAPGLRRSARKTHAA
ncbi:MAG TPA: VWA domain-containing protein [Planctomycetaceae bacterium]|nr:VWA domain-containing protein [Planctomycetaceae bacterium]